MIFSAIIYLIIHLFPIFIDPSLLWGIDSWSYYNLFISISLLLIGFVLILLSNKIFLYNYLQKICYILKQIPYPIWIVIVGILFIILSQKLFLLGDGALRVRNAEGAYMFSTTEPMDTWLHSWLYQIMKPILNITGVDIFAITSILSGVIALVGSSFYLRKIFPDNYLKRLFILLTVFLSASVQLFFGYVESYSIMACFVILYLFSTISQIEKKKISLSSVLFLSFGIIFHPQAIIFIPSAVYTNIQLIRITKIVSIKKTITLLVLIFLLPIISMLIFFLIQRYDLSKFFNTASSNLFLPFFSNQENYGIISLEHFIDIINLLLLTTPAIIAFPFILKVAADQSRKFLLFTSISFFIFLLIFKPDLGFSRDWDLFSIFGFTSTMLIAFSIVNIKNMKKYKLAFLVIIISILHTIPWIYNNSNESLSINRAQNLANTYYWSAHSKAILYEEIAQYHYKKCELLKALENVEKAQSIEPNERFSYSLAVIHNELGNKDMACEIFEKIKFSGSMTYNINLFLGNIYFEKNKLNEAERSYLEVLKISPNNENVVFNMGIINFKLNKLPEATNYFKFALRLNPNNKETLNYLGQIYFDLKNYSDAARIFLKIDILEPNNFKINYYLSLCFANKNLLNDAIKYLERSKNLGLDSISYNELRNSIHNIIQKNNY